jgi:hypothetical protein
MKVIAKSKFYIYVFACYNTVLVVEEAGVPGENHLP